MHLLVLVDRLLVVSYYDFIIVSLIITYVAAGLTRSRRLRPLFTQGRLCL